VADHQIRSGLGNAQRARLTLDSGANLARGYSGVRPELIEMLLKFLNADITPVIPEEGSVGASGDLVPLSYVAAALVGRRNVHFRGQIVAAADALNEVGLAPLVLGPKEGLAVVNGTAYMTGIAALACVDAKRLADVADVCTAMTVEVLGGITTPFHQFLHDITKPHPGQARSAANIRGFLAGSRMGRPYEEVVAQLISGGETATQDLPQIQDMYSLRCAPHFIGVLWDVLAWAEQWVEIEINSSTDNPLLDPESGQVFSGGNFSGDHIALAMDTLKAAVASVADLLDRQLELVVDEKYNRGLGPTFCHCVKQRTYAVQRTLVAQRSYTHEFARRSRVCTTTGQWTPTSR
jgi:histidine ammonia-lyase